MFNNAFDWMLNKDHRELAELYDYLHSFQQSKYTRAELEDGLGWSTYKVQTYVSRLMEDIDNNFDDQAQTLSWSADGKYVVVDGLKNADAALLRTLYAKEALPARFLMQGITHDLPNLQEFAEKNNVSLSTAQKILRELRQHYDLDGISINTRFQIIGNELGIRYWLHQYFYNMHAADAIPDELSVYTFSPELVAELITLLGEFDIELSNLDKVRLQYSMNVIGLRIRTGHFVTKEQLGPWGKNLDQLDAHQQAGIAGMQKAFKKAYPALTDEDAYCEAVYNWTVFHILYTLQEDGFWQNHPMMAVYLQVIKTGRADFEAAFGVPIIDYQTAQIGERLFTNIMHFLFVKQAIPRTDCGEAFGTAEHPILSYVVSKILEHQAQILGVSAKQIKLSLFNEVLVTFLSSLDMKKLMEPVYIYVDFSEKATMRDFVINKIKNTAYMHEVFVDNVDDADIIISDTKLAIPPSRAFVIWSVMPNEKQWNRFEQRLRAITVAKFNAKHHANAQMLIEN
ncbi:MAG: helix-turn-helix domain-containing protein [Lactobacillaceae bacterium]|nr:helix-turn-helix domain-containing protein [Lactobacillaceae bacterium]